jgi:hypothetical protein
MLLTAPDGTRDSLAWQEERDDRPPAFLPSVRTTGTDYPLGIGSDHRGCAGTQQRAAIGTSRSRAREAPEGLDRALRRFGASARRPAGGAR